MKVACLKLDHHFRESNQHFVHKFVHKLRHFFIWDALLAQAEIEGVFNVLVGVCTKVKAYWDR